MSGILALIIAVGLPGSSFRGAPQYRIRELRCETGSFNVPRSINDVDQVVGCCNTEGGGTVAYVYDKGKFLALAPLKGSVETIPASINNRGVVVGRGTGKNKFDLPTAFLHRDGKTSPLSAKFGYASSDPTAINDKGQIVGSLALNDHGPENLATSHAFLWTRGKLKRLPTLGGLSSNAFGVNSSGQVVGTADTSADGESSHACLWSADRIYDLGTLGGPKSIAMAINDSEVIVGESDLKDGSGMACRWYKGKRTALGRIPGFDQSTANAVNKRGEIVGNAFGPAFGESRALLYRNERLFILNDLIPRNSGWTLETANAINSRGVIVGVGRLKGIVTGYVLYPVPSSSVKGRMRNSKRDQH